MQDTDINTTEIYTIGFTKKGAKKFFSLLEDQDIERLVDVRLRNRSQLSGFAKRDDLRYFLNELLDIEYMHREELAPSKDLLDKWRNDSISWEEFEERFDILMEEREIERQFSPSLFEENTVLLCSEHEPQHCHRRLIIEYLEKEWGKVESKHLVE
jgi:uncharacterized protein (DUF488 family)